MVVEGSCSVSRNFANFAVPVLADLFLQLFFFGGGGFAGNYSILIFLIFLMCGFGGARLPGSFVDPNLLMFPTVGCCRTLDTYLWGR